MAERSQDSPPMPRVLFVGNFLSGTGGVPQACEDLSNRFEQEGWAVLRTSSKPGRGARLANMVGTAVKRHKDFDAAQIDVFSGQAFVWAEAVSTVLRAQRKPFVVSLHGGELPEFSDRYPGRVRRLLRSATAVTCPSAHLADRMREHRGDIRVIPNPIDLKVFEYQKREQIRPKLVWVRAFHAVYEPWVAVEVLGHLSSSHPDASLVLYGPDKGDGSLSKTQVAIERLGLGGRVDIGGPIPNADVPRALQRGDIFLNTSVVDNVPRSVVEAMACGLNVVSTDVGGIPCILEDGVDGLLVPPDDSEVMAEAVLRLVREPTLAERLSGNGRRKVESHDWSIVMPQWENLFREVSNHG